MFYTKDSGWYNIIENRKLGHVKLELDVCKFHASGLYVYTVYKSAKQKPMFCYDKTFYSISSLMKRIFALQKW